MWDSRHNPVFSFIQVLIRDRRWLQVPAEAELVYRWSATTANTTSSRHSLLLSSTVFGGRVPTEF